MSRENAGLRSSTCSVEPGLYVLRYLRSDGAGDPPLARVAPMSGRAHEIDVVIAPGQVAGILQSPGDSVVLVVHCPSAVEVLIDGDGSAECIDATLKLECLSRRDGAGAESATPANRNRLRAPARPARKPSRVRVFNANTPAQSMEWPES